MKSEREIRAAIKAAQGELAKALDESRGSQRWHAWREAYTADQTAGVPVQLGAHGPALTSYGHRYEILAALWHARIETLEVILGRRGAGWWPARGKTIAAQVEEV